jgi:hypothetical protein
VKFTEEVAVVTGPSRRGAKGRRRTRKLSVRSVVAADRREPGLARVPREQNQIENDSRKKIKSKSGARAASAGHAGYAIRRRASIARPLGPVGHRPEESLVQSWASIARRLGPVR